MAADSELPKKAAEDQWLPVGRVVGAQGLRGELRVNPASEFPERFTKPGSRWLQAKGKTPQEVTLINGRQLPGKNLFVVRFRGVNNREAAEGLIGQTLLVNSDDRPTLGHQISRYADHG